MYPDKNYVVTGAAGVLGNAVVAELIHHGRRITGLGRRAKPVGFLGEWSQCDLKDLESVGRSLAAANVVIHCASSPFTPWDDRIAMRNLITAAKQYPCHITYVSICGIESAAVASDYYKSKLADEKELESSGVSYTIVRITQFHPFVSHLLSRLVLGPFLLAPKLRLQPIDVPFAAQEVCKFAMSQTNGRTPDIHGPESLNEENLIACWLKAKHRKKVVIPVPRLGKLKPLGSLQPVEGICGGRTWSQWLMEDANSFSPYSW